ncbi:MAG: hypothetical protein EAX95_01390 [Candidatus Thorarchaeota archaeon]|nr:hypothetical protein [Candidatus Thorarchaeota archaeon]
MLRFKGTSNIVAIVVVALIILSSIPGNVKAQDSLDPIVIIYDASNRPQFSATDEEEGFKLLFDMVNASTRYLLKVNTGTITNETLSEADILIIGEHAISEPYEDEEIKSISYMLANGSSLLVLGNPTIPRNSTYWSDTTLQTLGDNRVLNDLLDGLNMTSPRFSTNVTGDGIWGDAMFDYDQALNESYPWVLRLDATAWNSLHPIFNDINELVLMTATLKPIDLASSLATGYESSFAQFRVSALAYANYSFPNMTLDQFAESPLSYSAINGTFPSWLSAFEFNQSRVVISGSGIMFTGLDVDVYDADTAWFYTADNARLFMNMLNWLSEEFVEAPGAIEPMLIISGTILVVGVAYYLLKKLR